ncbi:N-acetylmuramoyl-L-alanine amidase [Rhizobium leguminosarum]|uniref:N-acetylmuramoyl-L-alanine amidase n=1 Tax=Rhizobium leguminosarum TaxID=384 RepID=UPI001C91D3AA|nr:N-acetylmuramoyl-L-alanine amidase [Rhizobium leguminosarum]MBY2914155.1 hypothetical protein [Rhizobium leguminosarum]MBY2969694.1 hypothetical protein [Rhizobium leguminosarum]MBY2977067.1 hypothetical protein [Rhizobium leguminosarum]MBY3005617.1 hypothetical protein [Rhizobium leguminosarum]
MSRLPYKLLAVATFALLHLSIAHAKDDEVEAGAQPGATAEEIALAIQTLSDDLRKPSSTAFSPADVRAWVDKAKSAYGNLRTENGQVDISYDIVIQAGHYKRSQGRTGGEGRHVIEQDMSAWVGKMLSENLKARGYKALLIDADHYAKGMKPRIFLALHTDSSALPCRLGPSVGYDSVSDSDGMHAIALALALTMAADPTEFMKDSYTSGLKSYYAFADMNVSEFEGVLEMAELSCPPDEEKLLSRAEVLADNLAVAVVFALKEPFQ